MFSNHSEKYEGQKFLLEIAAYLKLPTNPEKGKCVGITHTGIASFLMDDDENFHHLNLFNDNVVQIHNAWEKLNKNSADSLPQDTINTFKDFYKDILYYQEPEKHKEKLGDEVSQFTPSHIAQILYNGKDKNVVEATHYFLPFFKKHELDYFFYLIEKYAEEKRIALSVSANGHRIGLGFSGKTKQWFVINANVLPVFATSLNSLTGLIFRGHSCGKDESFSIRFFSTSSCVENIRILLNSLDKDEEFKKMINSKAEELYRLNKYNDSLVHLSTKYNHLIFLNYLLPLLNANSLNDKGCTPLHLAASLNHPDAAALLLARPNTKLNIQNEKGKTPLYYSASKGNVRLTQILLEKGADPFINCEKGTNAITIASKKGHHSLFKILYDKKIDLTKPDKNNNTALYYAKKAGHEKVMSFFQKNNIKKRPAEEICEQSQSKKFKNGT